MKNLNKAAALATAVLLFSHLAFGENAGDKSLPKMGDAPKSYQIANKKYGDLLRPRDANGSDGTPIVLYPAQPWKCMTWKLTPQDESAFTVRNHFTGNTFTFDAGREKAGKEKRIAQIPLAKDSAKAIQWKFVTLKDGNYRIADPKSGDVLTAVKDETNGDVRIALLPWEDKDEQKWDLQVIDPSKLTM
jgi:hypothetical protein